MAAGIVYLDVDDEITSAASRIRSSTNPRVALVVPYGSRIATSRMNFRLLSREALVSNRRLSIVAGDAASRALAASAGLPVFATVAEYESANAPVAGTDADERAGDASRDAPPAPGASGAIGPEVALGGDAAIAALDDATVDEAATSTRPVPRVAAATSLAASETVAGIGPAVGESTPPAIGPAAQPVAATVPPVILGPGPARSGRGRAARPTAARRPAATRPIADDGASHDEPTWRRAVRTPALVGAAVIGLAIVVLAVAAYLVLPAATIAVTPRREPISVSLTVTADPSAAAVDAADATIPAMRLDVPVEASQTFTTTGVHVDEKAARGSVTFANYDTGGGVTIRGGSIVSTEAGVNFKTQGTVSLQPAAIFPAFQPSTGSVDVVATKTGDGGNVPANTIRVVPQGQDPVLLRVNNPAPTTGGVKTQTPQVSQAEIDKALATLHMQLRAAFDDAVASGAGAPAGATVFPRTAVLGDATPSVNPQSLVGQPVATYDLSLAANGNVIAVDPSPIQSLAETALTAKVGADHRLVSGSVQVQVGDGSVDETGTVTFDATARGQRIALLDANQLRSLVKGRSAADAKAALAPFGDVRVDLWPTWATTVTTLDPRLTLTIDESAGSPEATPGPSSAVRTSQPSPSRRPSPPTSARPSTSAVGSAAP